MGSCGSDALSFAQIAIMEKAGTDWLQKAADAIEQLQELELARADREGRRVVPPCKVGDDVFTLDDLGRLHECEVRGIHCGRMKHENYIELEPIGYRGRKYGASFGAFGKLYSSPAEEAAL